MYLDRSYFNTYDEDFIATERISAKARNALPDSLFGLPEDRKYPLDTEDRIKDAIKFFHFCKDVKLRKELAHNIARRIVELDAAERITFKTKHMITNYFTAEDKKDLIFKD